MTQSLVRNVQQEMAEMTAVRAKLAVQRELIMATIAEMGGAFNQ